MIDILTYLYERATIVFNNRELAIGLWLGIVAIYCVPRASIRHTIKTLFCHVFGSRLFLIFGGLGLWLFLGTTFLAWIHWWTISELKLTILWFLFSGTTLLTRSITRADDQSILRQSLRDQLKITVLLEAAVVFYSFSFLTELLFVPFVSILALTLTLSETKSEFAVLRPWANFVSSVVGVSLSYHFVAQTITTRGAFFNVTTLRELTMPIMLMIWASPYCYVFDCSSRWGTARLQVNAKTYHCDTVRNYALRKFFWILFFRPTLLARAVRQFNELPAKNTADVDEIVCQIFKYERNKRRPPTVSSDAGWCPYAAERFLGDDGLETGDFHKTGVADKWRAKSTPLYVNNVNKDETLVYRIEGTDRFVTTLELEGQFKIAPSPEAAVRRMRDVAARLTQVATAKNDLPAPICRAFDAMSDAETRTGRYGISLAFTTFNDPDIVLVEFAIFTKT